MESEPLLDQDVQAEQNLAREAFDRGGKDSECALAVKDLSKRFGSFRAVRGLSFIVKQGVFGAGAVADVVWRSNDDGTHLFTQENALASWVSMVQARQRPSGC